MVACQPGTMPIGEVERHDVCTDNTSGVASPASSR